MSLSDSDGPRAEFDDYALNYSAGMDNPLKKRMGGDAEDFIEVKTDWLVRDLSRAVHADASNGEFGLLDYGCGAGTLLSLLRRRGLSWTLAGCDISQEMLKEARSRWSLDDPPDFRAIVDEKAPFDSAQFDAVVLSSVLHHVETASRGNVYSEALRVLKPGGRIYIFEHNPYNPVTRWVVKHTPIDKNAVLLTPTEVCAGLDIAGARGTRKSYIMFFPPKWASCRRFERLIHWLPCGAQYVVAAEKAAI
jgi:SAM-dependent methyltransferase